MDSGAARSPQSRVAGNRDLSGRCIDVRNGDGHSRAVRCAIHMVRGIWGASGRLVGSPALAAYNGLAITTSRVTHGVGWPRPLRLNRVILPVEGEVT